MPKFPSFPILKKLKTKMGKHAPATSSPPVIPPLEPNAELPASEMTTAVDFHPKEEEAEDGSLKFTLFTEFPIEIRLQIFKAMFPRGRHVCLDAGFIWTFNYEPSVHSQNRLPLLPTLFINQESRAETLKHYYVVFKQDSDAFKGYEPFPERPFVFNPTIDSVYITFGSLHGGTNYRRFGTWIEYLNAQLPAGTSSIQSLEIRDMHWMEVPLNAWIQGESPMEGLAKWNKARGLQWFRGLKELCFTQCRNSDNGLRYRRGDHPAIYPTPPPPLLLQQRAGEVTDWYNEYSNNVFDGKVPHVTVRMFHKVKWSALNMV